MYDFCVLLVKYDYDWALFIQAMMDAAAIGYGDPGFISTLALPENRIPPMSQTDLLIQATILPNSRIRNFVTTTNGAGETQTNQEDSTMVYLGFNTNENANSDSNQNNDAQLFTTCMSAAYIVEDAGSRFTYGFDDLMGSPNQLLQSYLGTTDVNHDWDNWDQFGLYPGTNGVLQVNKTDIIFEATSRPGGGVFQTPFGGPNNTTALQIAAISSAAGGSGSPAIPSTFTQMWSIGQYKINEWRVLTVWRVLAGVAAGLGATFIVGALVRTLGPKCNACTTQESADKAAGILGILFGVLVGLVTGFFYGIGGNAVPNLFNKAVGDIYRNASFDNFAVCSQWPNPCGEQDAFMIDGWFTDNPTLVINVAQHQKLKQNPLDNLQDEGPLKVIITNTNEVWDNEFNRVQFLQYFSSYFNQGVAPGDFLWAPTYFIPYRSPQIFEEYLDADGLDALLEPIENSNGTTAILRGTTVDNPAFGIVAGQSVEILLLNANANITTYVMGAVVIEELTQPLADMAKHIAASEELVNRVKEFVGSEIDS